MNARRSIRGRWCSMVVLIAFAAMLAVCILPASALPCDCDICVNETGWWNDTLFTENLTTPIQAAVDNANAGETICVGDGTYHENVDVNVAHLTIRSENGSANCIVNAASSGDHVFEVTADYANISGFAATRATGDEKVGIYLNNGADHCNISNNNCSNNNYGIILSSSSNNTLTNNNASSNWGGIFLLSSSNNNTLTNNTASSNNNYGIFLRSSSNNTLTENNADSNDCGICLEYSSNYNTLTSNNASSNNNYGIFLSYLSNNNTITNNTANSNTQYGIWLLSSSNNTLTSNNASGNNYGIYMSSSSNNQIYNNHFNNTNNVYDNGNNIWNTTKTAGTNIIGGSWLGGNYWSDYAGADTNGDGLGDTLTPYNSSSEITYGGDYHPLVTPSSVTPTPSSSGGEGTYPPGWHETPTATVTATKAPAASATATATDAPPGERVTPAATKAKPAAAKATAPAAEGTATKKPAKGAPGFTAVFVIAGMLAVAYAMMRRRG